MTRNIKGYLIVEILLTIVTLIYNFKLTKFNDGLDKWLLPYGDSILLKSLKMFEYQDGLAYQYLYGAIIIIFLSCAITAFFWIKFLRYSQSSNFLILNVVSTLINIALIIVTLILISNPILWGFTIICVSGSFIMYTMSV